MTWPPPSPLHQRTAFSKKNITEEGAASFGVSTATFGDWRWQMKKQIQESKDPSGAIRWSAEDSQAFAELSPKFQAGVTPYYAALIEPNNPHCPIRKQAVPDLQENFDSLGVADPLTEKNNSPVPEVVHVYGDRVAFCVAQLCPVYCRYCFRKRRDEEEGLHYNPRIVAQGIEYISKNTAIRDVLITGGDPLVAHDHQILKVVAALRQIPHVEIIRIGTRVPVTLPYRITPELAKELGKFHPLWINTHFNCAEEVTAEAAAAIDLLLQAGIPVGNQSVLLRGVNDSVAALKALGEALIRIRVRPYYLYHPQVVSGTEHLRVPIEKGLDLMRGLRGATTGFAIPSYILDTPYGKLPLTPQNILGRKGESLIIESNDGRLWSEPSPLAGYQPTREVSDFKETESKPIASLTNLETAQEFAT